MKKIGYIAGLLLTVILSGCSKPDGDKTQEGPVNEPIGIYIYDGEEYPVHSAVYASTDNSIVVRISPFRPDEKQTTYAIIGINRALEGKMIDVETAWNNDDYYFRYEDPVKYYSEYRSMQSGTIYMKMTGDSPANFSINVDLVLPDGTDFIFEYHGTIDSATP